MKPPHCPIKYGSPKENQEPPSVPAEQQVGNFTPSFDQRLWLFDRRWEPENEIVATLMIVHGTVDHSGVYEELASKLNQVGIAVFAQDMRGWGLSDGESMYIDDFDTFCKDVEHYYNQVHNLERYRDVKHRFLMGKSIGGIIAAHCVAQYPTLWTGLLGLSGAYGSKSLPTSTIKTSVLATAAYFFPKTPFKKLFDESLIVADEGALQAWREDPLCCKDKVRLGYLVHLTQRMRDVDQLEMPESLPSMLMMVGADDQVVTPSGHELMLSKCSPKTSKDIKVYDKGRHNVLQEPSLKDQVTMDIQTWILEHATST